MPRARAEISRRSRRAVDQLHHLAAILQALEAEVRGQAQLRQPEIRRVRVLVDEERIVRLGPGSWRAGRA